jgi:NADH-quinone oxidoreductase subunit G
MVQIADIVLPSPAYTEQDGLFINLEGRLQKCLKASYPPGSSKEDWKIFNLINKRLKNNFIFKNFQELREDTLKKIKNHSDYGLLPKTNTKLIKPEYAEFFSENVEIKQLDYYFSNAIARSSKTMSDCKIARNNNSKK